MKINCLRCNSNIVSDHCGSCKAYYINLEDASSFPLKKYPYFAFNIDDYKPLITKEYLEKLLSLT